MGRRLNTAILCYSMNRAFSSPAGGLGQAMMALLSVFGRNFVPKVRENYSRLTRRLRYELIFSLSPHYAPGFSTYEAFSSSLNQCIEPIYAVPKTYQNT